MYGQFGMLRGLILATSKKILNVKKKKANEWNELHNVK